MVWPLSLFICIFQMVTSSDPRLPSDGCHWYSCPVLPTVCGISWRTWERGWTAEYAECDAVRQVHRVSYYVHASYLAS